MRITFFTLALLTMALIGRGQPINLRKYLDKDLHFTSKKQAVYHATATADGNHWVLEAMYPRGGIVLRMVFADNALTIKDGLYAVYHSNGKPWMEGHFVDNKATGCWQSWYDNGQLRDSGHVADNHFSGQWKHWYANGQLKKAHEYLAFPDELPAFVPANTGGNMAAANVIDTLTAGYLSISGIADGRWQSWYEDGQLECDGMASHGVPSGTWKWFRENGQPASIETYSLGKITQLECYDEQGKLTGNSCSVLKPAVFTHPTLNARDYIAGALQRHSLTRSDVGSAQIRFVIDKTGKIRALVISGLRDDTIQYNIIDILKTMPAWSPAVSHNRFIDYPVSITLY